MTQPNKLVTLGGLRTMTKIATPDTGAASPTEAVPSQARGDKQKHGIMEKDFSNIVSGTSNTSATWTVSEAEAANKVLKTKNVSSVMANSDNVTVYVPADGMWFVDHASGGTGNGADVKTSKSSTGVTVATGQVAAVMTTGGTVRRLTADTTATT